MLINSTFSPLPGIIVVAPKFEFFDAADACKVIEEELCMYDIKYLDHSDLGRQCAISFMHDAIPFVSFWL